MFEWWSAQVDTVLEGCGVIGMILALSTFCPGQRRHSNFGLKEPKNTSARVTVGSRKLRLDHPNRVHMMLCSSNVKPASSLEHIRLFYFKAHICPD